MSFTEQFLPEIRTPILVPHEYRVVGLKDSLIEYIHVGTGTRYVDELLFWHGKNAVFPRTFKRNLPHDSVIVLLFGPSNKLYLQRRSKTKWWAPGEIDLASVAGQRRALLAGDHFENEELDEVALREISEETGVPARHLSQRDLCYLGSHFNPHTNEYQAIYAYRITVSLDQLNKNAALGTEVEEWIEQDYAVTMEEYFSERVKRYAGGAEMRPVNFISRSEIREKLDAFFSSLCRQHSRRNAVC